MRPYTLLPLPASLPLLGLLWTPVAGAATPRLDHAAAPTRQAITLRLDPDQQSYSGAVHIEVRVTSVDEYKKALHGEIPNFIGITEPYEPPTESSDEEWWDRLVYGPPERCIAQIQRDADLGFTEFICWFDVGGLPHETVVRSMRRFAAEVMPAFTGRPAAVTS